MFARYYKNNINRLKINHHRFYSEITKTESSNGNNILNATIGIGMLGLIGGFVNFLYDFPEPLPTVWKMCNENEQVTKEMGEPLSKSLFWDGSINESQASVTLPVSGPNGDGSVYARFIKNKDDMWEPYLIVLRHEKSLIKVFEKK